MDNGSSGKEKYSCIFALKVPLHDEYICLYSYTYFKKYDFINNCNIYNTYTLSYIYIKNGFFLFHIRSHVKHWEK